MFFFGDNVPTKLHNSNNKVDVDDNRNTIMMIVKTTMILTTAMKIQGKEDIFNTKRKGWVIRAHWLEECEFNDSTSNGLPWEAIPYDYKYNQRMVTSSYSETSSGSNKVNPQLKCAQFIQ